MMSKKYIMMAAALLIAVAVPGCYTELMTIQEFSQARRERAAVKADASYSLNYNQNCVSCHTVSELDDRYLELKYYNVSAVHGMTLNPSLWVGSPDIPFGEDVYFPRPILIAQPNPWWLPPATITTGGNTIAAPPSQERTRTTGTTREGTREHKPGTTGQSPATPPATNPAPSTPPTGTITTPASTTTTSSGTGERPRTGSSDSGGSKTRTEGASRDNGNRPR